MKILFPGLISLIIINNNKIWALLAGWLCHCPLSCLVAFTTKSTTTPAHLTSPRRLLPPALPSGVGGQPASRGSPPPNPNHSGAARPASIRSSGRPPRPAAVVARALSRGSRGARRAAGEARRGLQGGGRRRRGGFARAMTRKLAAAASRARP